jgi:hypothetical protein
VSFRDTAITKSEIQLSQTNANLLVLPIPHPLSFPNVYHHQFMLFVCHTGTSGRDFFFVILPSSTIVEFYMHYTNNLYLHGLNSFYHSGPLPASSTTDVSIFNLVTFALVSN